MTSPIRLLCLICFALNLGACAPMLSLIGTNQTIVQVTAQVERVKVAGDGASLVTSRKTVSDHATSLVMGQDCRFMNVLDKEPVCKEIHTVNTAATANGQTQPVAAATPGAQPQTQTTAPRAPEIDRSREPASGD